jgi:hypothetical protein
VAGSDDVPPPPQAVRSKVIAADARQRRVIPDRLMEALPRMVSRGVTHAGGRNLSGA